MGIYVHDVCVLLFQKMSLSIMRAFVYIYLLVFMLIAPVQAGVYRWVDSSGEVHFSDQVPPEDARQERKLIGSDGRVLEITERAKTAEELKEQARLDKIQAKKDEQVRLRKEHDRMLLLTYQSVEEINSARDEKIETLENAIQISMSTLRSQRKRMNDLRQRAADFERSSRPIPKKVITDMALVKGRIINTNKYINRRQQEQEALRKEFSMFVKRYKELTE